MIKLVRESFVLVFLITIITSNLFAQHDHDEFKDRYIKSAPVKYTIKSEIKADSGVVNSDMEIEFVNESDSLIDKIYLALPLNAFQEDGLLDRRYDLYGDSTLSKILSEDRPSIVIDSILYLGVPCESVDSLYANSVLGISLVRPLGKGERGHLLLSFRSKFSKPDWEKRHTVLLSNWFPKLYDLNDSIDFEPYFGWNNLPLARADMTLSVTIDSTFEVISGGELFNEKERFGILNGPKDSVWVDLYENHTFDLIGNKYQTILKNGRKYYFYKSWSHTDAPLLIGKDLKFDLLQRKNSRHFIVYNEDTKFDWGENAALILDSSISLIADYLGVIIEDDIKIAASDTLLLSQPDDNIIFIPRDIKNGLEMKIFITNGLLIRLITVSNPSARDLNEALAYYLTAKILFEKDGSDIYEKMEDIEKRFKKKSALKLFEKDKKLQFAWGRELVISDSIINEDVKRFKQYVYQRFRLIPSLLALNNFKYGNNFIYSFMENDETIADSIIDSHSLDTLLDIDFSIDSIEFNKINDSFEVTFIVTSNYENTPVEIGIVYNLEDTLYDRLDYSDYADLKMLQYKTKSVIDAVIVDPNYQLPDINRYNNFHFRMPKKHNFSDPKSLFIGFREF